LARIARTSPRDWKGIVFSRIEPFAAWGYPMAGRIASRGKPL